MSQHRLVVGLGDRRYRVERPWGDLPSDAGRVSDVTVDSRGHVFVLLRYDPLVDAPGTPVVELDRDGARVKAWGADMIADSHMLACTDDDRLYIVDRDAHEVVICSTAGKRATVVRCPGEMGCSRRKEARWVTTQGGAGRPTARAERTSASMRARASA